MNKLPEITLNDWLEAEAQVRAKSISERVIPQPEGSITPTQYAELTNRSRARAQAILKELFRAGKATRERWYLPIGGFMYVYWLKK